MGGGRQNTGFAYAIADVLTLSIEFLTYFASFAAPLGALWRTRQSHVMVLVILAFVGWLAAATIFLSTLVAAKRLLVGEVPCGRFLLTGSGAYRWMFADRLVKIMMRSPFRGLVCENAIFRWLFYRGMGAHFDFTLLMGVGAKFTDPWLVTVGRNVLLGDDAVLAGHKVEHNTVTLDRIEIGDNVLIGARTIVFPGVRIGDGAVIGANSVVTRGTVVPAGETWAGNPARKVEVLPPRSSRPVKQPARRREAVHVG